MRRFNLLVVLLLSLLIVAERWVSSVKHWVASCNFPAEFCEEDQQTPRAGSGRLRITSQIGTKVMVVNSAVQGASANTPLRVFAADQIQVSDTEGITLKIV